MKTERTIIGYKGFEDLGNGRLRCMDKTYIVGHKYKNRNDYVKLCRSGFHACHELWQAMAFYPNNGKNVYHRVECSGRIEESTGTSGKFVCSRIKILGRVDVSSFEKFRWCSGFSEGIMDVSYEAPDGRTRYNVITTEGKFLAKEGFERIGQSREGMTPVFKDGVWRVIDRDANYLPGKWDMCVGFAEGFAPVKKERKGWNFIGKDGATISKKWWENVVRFNEGFAAVMNKKAKWNFIGNDGEKISKEDFDGCMSFINGFALVWKYEHTKDGRDHSVYNYLRPDGRLLVDKWFNQEISGFRSWKDKDGKWQKKAVISRLGYFGETNTYYLTTDGKEKPIDEGRLFEAFLNSNCSIGE